VVVVLSFPTATPAFPRDESRADAVDTADLDGDPTRSDPAASGSGVLQPAESQLVDLLPA